MALAGRGEVTMANRKGKFIGAYINPLLVDYVRSRARLEHKTLTETLESIIRQAKTEDDRNAIADRVRKNRNRVERGEV